MAYTDRTDLDLEHGDRLRDLLKLVELPLATSGTDFAGLPPGFFRPDIRVPKGPGAALPGAGFVHRAFPGLRIKKDAVAVLVLDQAFSHTHISDVLGFKVGYRHVYLLGKLFDFFLVDPNVSRRSRAAISALSALESKAILVPRLFHDRLSSR